MQREVLAVQKWVLGEKHPDTLRSARLFAASLPGQGRQAEAREAGRGTCDAA